MDVLGACGNVFSQRKISLARETFWLRIWIVSKWRVLAAVGFFSLCLSLSAQQIDRSGVFSMLTNSPPRFPFLTLSDGGLFSFSSALTWLQPTPSDFLPGLPTLAPRRTVTTPSSRVADTDSSKEAVDVQRSGLFDYTSAEVGFLYGRSTGKFGGDYKQGYITGEVGDDKFHISVGAAYEESNFRVPRFGR